MQPFRSIYYRLIAVLALVALLAACAPAPQAPSLQSTPEASAPQTATSDPDAATTYPLTIQNGENTLVFEKAPERAVSLNLHTTELMLALGLADKLIGTAYGNATILPEFEAEYQAIPVLAERYPTLEVLVAAEPDFTYGRGSAYGLGEDGVASVEQLAELGIQAYIVQGTLVEAGTMEDVYTDIHNLGQIFDIQPRAEELIQSMQAEISAIQEQIGDVDAPVRVLVYDAGTDDLFTAGQSLQTHLISLAGGENVFSDVEANWTTVSWEEAVAREPEVIVINDYGEVSLAEKISFLENNPALSSMPAIQNKRFVAISLPSVFEGVRNPDAIRTLAEGFYPEKFAEGAPTAASASGFPVTINNCGIKITYDAPPQRAVSMNQSTTEIMLKLGLQKQMAGTANLVDAILPELEAAYHAAPILADGYPAQEVVFAAEPDFVYGAFRGAFGDEAAGPRTELLKLGINSYLSPLFCEDRALAAKEATFELLYGEIRDIGRIFGVDDRAEALIAEMQSALAEVQRTIGEPSQRARVLWYDSNIEEPFVGACCGAPAMLMAAAGAENVFADTEGTWAVVNWENIVDRAPEVIVFVESDWSTVQEQIDYLLNEPAFASIPAVQNQRFVFVPFSATTLGVRNVAGVVELAKGLYPEKFE